MRAVTDIHPQALRELSAAHLIHGEIMNEMVELESQIQNPLSKHHMPYLNGKMDALVAVYGLLNDIQWEQEKLERGL